MEEKKKRWRPSLTLYRQVVNELSQEREYSKTLVGERDALKDERKALAEQVEQLRAELALVSRERDLLQEIADNRAAEVKRLKCRGLLACIFNK